MSFNLKATIDEIVGLVTTYWPEVSSGSIRTGVMATKTQIVEEIKAGTTSTPAVVISIGQMTPDSDWGLGNDYQRGPVSIHYITKMGPNATDKSTLSQAGVDARLRVLRAPIDSNSAVFTNFQVAERGAVDTSEASPINAQLMGADKLNIIVGTIFWSPGFIFEG